MPLLLDQVEALKYATAPDAHVYRALVEVFYGARERYVVELRTAEILEALRAGHPGVEAEGGDWLDRHLDQLVQWGNLARRHDSAAVVRLEDFYRRSFVYALTAVGETAHRAVAEVEATVGRSGSLQTNMLVKIRDTLADLALSNDPERLKTLLHDLKAAFGTLTEEASRFLGELERHNQDEHLDEAWFEQYKQAVLAYVGRFVDKLRGLAAEIAGAVRAVEARGIAGLLCLAAASQDLPPALDGRDPVAEWTREEGTRWAGLAAWFVEGPGHEPTVSRLADAAVDAVISLTRSLGRLNDRRVRPIDRGADLRTLARWFAACESDADAHRLFQTAFGLHGARHFVFVDDDPEITLPSTSWWDASPVEVPVRLRTHGKVTRAGRNPAAADRSTAREWIAQRRRREQARAEEGLGRFVGEGPVALSRLGALGEADFDQLLVLLDEALSSPRDAGGGRAARTGDGRLLVRLEPPSDPAAVALVQTGRGRLRCRDYLLTVERLGAFARAGEGGA